MNAHNTHKKLVLRYAAITAKGDGATDAEKTELASIEDQLHLSKESILKKATEFGLANIK
jgi:Na+-translocating ferredoxin:NAD+ oxidoreductase RnfC subunit